MTREEYMARRKEIREKIVETRIKERKRMEQVEDDKLLAHRNAENKIKAFTERVLAEKLEQIRYLNRCADDIHAKYAAEREELDLENKILDAEFRRQYYAGIEEGGQS